MPQYHTVRGMLCPIPGAKDKNEQERTRAIIPEIFSRDCLSSEIIVLYQQRRVGIFSLFFCFLNSKQKGGKVMKILTKRMVDRAIEMVVPSVEKILEEEGTTWGPKWVAIMVNIASEETINPHYYQIGEVFTIWQKGWGKEKSFSQIALAKLIAAEREGTNTSILVATQPWKLRKGEYLYPGGVTRDGISIGVSGAKGIADEAIAEMIVSAIVMLAKLETERRIEEKRNKI